MLVFIFSTFDDQLALYYYYYYFVCVCVSVMLKICLLSVASVM